MPRMKLHSRGHGSSTRAQRGLSMRIAWTVHVAARARFCPKTEIGSVHDKAELLNAHLPGQSLSDPAFVCRAL